MLLAPHFIVGATIGALNKNPLVVLPIALISHYLLDMIPHWQETRYPYKPYFGTYIRLIVDLAVSYCLVMLAVSFYPQQNILILTAALISVLPDIDSLFVFNNALMRKGTWTKKLWDWDCQLQNETASLWGLAPQIIVVLVCMVILFTNKQI